MRPLSRDAFPHRTPEARRAFAAAARVVGRMAEELGRGWLAYDLDNAATGEEAEANLQEASRAR